MLESLDLLSTPADLLGGVPLQLPVDFIDEDPEQPRKEFDDDTLAELATTIRERGVRQPISVRRHPQQPDRWMVNFGARRLRASRLAGKSEVPAFVDDSPDTYDQVIENEQRDNLTALDLALFVKRRLAAGETQAEIGRLMGKSRTFITMACALIDPPEMVMSAYRSGRCRGLTELYELRKLHEHRPEIAQSLLQADQPITRASIAFSSQRQADTAQSATTGPRTAGTGAEPGADARRLPTQAVALGHRYTELAAEAEHLCARLEIILKQLSANRSASITDRVAQLRKRLTRFAS